MPKIKFLDLIGLQKYHQGIKKFFLNKKGDTMEGKLRLTENINYGSVLPETGLEGEIFFTPFNGDFPIDISAPSLSENGTKLENKYVKKGNVLQEIPDGSITNNKIDPALLEQLSGLNTEKVWENANINSVFPEQTITLPRSLENNELLMILNEENAAIYLSNSSPQAYMYSHGFETLGARFSKLTGDKVQFYAGYTGNYNKYGSDATEDNSRVKPQAMYIVTDKSSGGITSLLLKEINDALTSKGSKPITNVNELPKAIADIPNLVGGNIEKIWENASSTSGFPAQTVIFDYSKYKWLIVESKRYYDSDNYRQSVLVRPENGISFRNTFTSGSNQQIITYYRTGTIRSNGIDFSSGWYATPTEDKEYIQFCIPMAIYGIKEPEPALTPKPAGPQLLWENASPNSEFPEQKTEVIKNLHDQDAIIIQYSGIEDATTVSRDIAATATIFKGSHNGGVQYNHVPLTGAIEVVSRGAYVYWDNSPFGTSEQDKIFFDNGLIINGNTRTTNNDMLKPLRVLGIKFS